ncbi:MAG: T9SS C-terminal target domain-containing protein [Calditrichaeota bacterium]|nr:MAG: T9SS C-terminal target domain-containing protein [Calditrichota bacterium]MBL1205762.1 T9SS C-terminal target domain-containing protein [Calditrichota bacterium]NOG45590.1 T9SS type A sorting domain-containing protein [Calditrichota bacterium]
MKKVFQIIIISLAPILLLGTDVNVDASQKNAPNMRKIFDIFRSANRAPEGRLKEINSQMVRTFPPLSIEGFGTLFDVIRGTAPDTTYHWGFVDSWVGPILEEGGTVNLGYCYMPLALGDDQKGPPRDYDLWEDFNYNWAKYFNTKYGITSFEIWNEPDYGEFFSGSKSEYFEMYKYAVKGIKRAVPDARVGGPALAENPDNWIGPMLDFIIDNNLPIHFVSYHAQDNRDGFDDKGSKYHNRYKDILDELNARGMDSVEIHLNEFSYELDPGQGSKYDKVECAAWFASSFKFMLNEMPRLALFNKTITNNGELAEKWKYNGLVTTGNIPKAKYNLFKMYSKMPFSGIDVNVGNSNIDAMASVNDSVAGVMIWNKQDNTEEFTLNLANLPFIADSVQVFLIDPEHSSYFDDESTKELEKIETIALDKASYSDARTMLNHAIYLFLFKGSEQVSAINKPEYAVPEQYSLTNYPNPFNPTTTIAYQLKASGDVVLTVYDVMGRKVKTLVDNHQQSGSYEIIFDASGLASGVYYYQMDVTTSTASGSRIKQIKKMLLIQ